MNRRLIIVLAALMSLTLSAQRMWKVTGGDAKGESYLFGTHHVAPVSVLDSTPGFDQAIQRVDAMYGEIVMNAADSAVMQQKMMAYAMAPSDSTLSKVLSPAQIDSVNAVLSKYTMGMVNASQLEMMKPAIVNTQLAMLQSVVAFPEFNPAQQLDQTIQVKSAAAGKAVRGLESIDRQLEILLGDPISTQAADLMETIAKDDKAVEFAQKLADAYNDGDLERIAALMFDPQWGISAEDADRMLYSRNRDWVKQLREILPRESVLVAVGIGHLIGDEGLIKLLRDSGYTVKEVR